MPEPIRLALIGAGLFARDAHVPALKALGERFEVVAVYSRTRATAEALLPLLPNKADVYTDLATLLQRSDIEAVDAVVPIEVLPAAVEMALAAGKHVISEKPIAPDVTSGRRMLARYREHSELVWMVAENDRYVATFRRAAEIVHSGEIGSVIMAYSAKHLSATPDNPYYHTAWRRSGTFPGGFLLDGGVHHVAALRLIAGEIVSVSAQVRQMRDDLPPADTLSAVMEFKSGALGSYVVTYAADAATPTYLTVVGDKGLVRVNHESLEVTTDGTPLNESVSEGDDVEAELAAFADAIRDGAPHDNPPLEALRDVAVIEAMLNAAQLGYRVEVDPLNDLETPA